jgi:hypothetical protein
VRLRKGSVKGETLMTDEIKPGVRVTPRDDIPGTDIGHVGKVGIVLEPPQTPRSEHEVYVRYSNTHEMWCNKGILRIVPPE